VIVRFFCKIGDRVRPDFVRVLYGAQSVSQAPRPFGLSLQLEAHNRDVRNCMGVPAKGRHFRRERCNISHLR
jgi:hypothetical protein